MTPNRSRLHGQVHRDSESNDSNPTTHTTARVVNRSLRHVRSLRALPEGEATVPECGLSFFGAEYR